MTSGTGRGPASPHVWRCGIPRCLGSSKSAPVHTSPVTDAPGAVFLEVTTRHVCFTAREGWCDPWCQQTTRGRCSSEGLSCTRMSQGQPGPHGDGGPGRTCCASPRGQRTEESATDHKAHETPTLKRGRRTPLRSAPWDPVTPRGGGPAFRPSALKHLLQVPCPPGSHGVWLCLVSDRAEPLVLGRLYLSTSL